MKQFTKHPKNIECTTYPDINREREETLEILDEIVNLYSQAPLLYGKPYEDFIKLIKRQRWEVLQKTR
jgi:hypothetical protein